MARYREFFLDCIGNIEARDEFDAADDERAMLVAALLFDACADVYYGYELWSRERRVTGSGQPPTVTARSRARLDAMQLTVVEREDLLLESQQSVARSRRLLHETNELLGGLERKKPKQGN